MKMTNNKLLFLLLSVILASCDFNRYSVQRKVIYEIQTTGIDGYAIFSSKRKNVVYGSIYQDNGTLIAEKKDVRLKSGLKPAVIFNNHKKSHIIGIAKYEAPRFVEYPVTYRYTDSVYAVKPPEEVEYGYVRGFYTTYSGNENKNIFQIYLGKLADKYEKDLQLKMDVYMPEDDGKVLRPLLVLVHGGAFYSGDKSSLGYPEWSRYFASLGYVVASVNYRLGFYLTTASVEREGFHAVQDVNGAIRYIIHNNAKYGIDPERVFVAGTSAGAIIALNVAFMKDKDRPSSAADEGNINAVNNWMDYNFSVRAVGNMWGAVNDLSILNNSLGTSIISFHNRGDNIVPFGTGHPFKNTIANANEYLFPQMFGSKTITTYINNQNRAVIHEYDLDNTHEIHIDKNDITGKETLNQNFYDIEYAMRDFFSNAMLLHPVKAKHSNNSQMFRFDSYDVETISFKISGGVILDKGKDYVKVLFFPDEGNKTLVASGKYKSGLTFNEIFYSD